MNQKQPNAERPARTPQILLDQFQRPVSIAPGFTKLEAVALELLPHFINAGMHGINLTSETYNGRKVGPIEAAFATAREFCAYVDALEETANRPKISELTPV